ncbi:MAG TPA: hypothetical protein VNL95_09490 [Dehalococcoidia bacterium]|nr:hypothetical protein [Dehalococcoidia bacterium]
MAASVEQAIARLRRQLEQVPWLRGRGPVSYHYGQWVDATHHALMTLFGEDSPEARGFLEIVGTGAAERGWGVPLAPDHQWGLRARLDRAEGYLRQLLEGLERQARAP